MKLTELQVEKIKEHMLHEDDALVHKFKARRTSFDTTKVLPAEVEAYVNRGWMVTNVLKTKTQLSRPKEFSRQFEDDIWCMFYELGFRILNSDEKLVIPWGENEEDKKQLDIVAVGDDAIFVVECKAADKPKSRSFQSVLNEMALYKAGVTDALRQVYGANKRMKFILATRNYQILDDGEDDKRMGNNDIYHLDDNAYKYICNLIKSYKTAVKYQFYSLMFKDELISKKPIVIPTLQGEIGGKRYYLFSIEPSTLLKIGFVLHRTKVNDSLAPTYQRLLVPKRLKGITKFIDGGGYFPNSILLNFADVNDTIKVTFDPIHKEEGSNAEFGLLKIPNAYGIAYIIDGQHRVYGYANSTQKEKHTIPVVAFQDMSNDEQLRIFMEINENQKAVSKDLRIDLEHDLLWTSERLDSRMKALRSSIIKELCGKTGTVLYNRITVGEDKGELGSIAFENGLSQCGLVPKAKGTKWSDDADGYLYDKKETNIDKAMTEASKRIADFIIDCYCMLAEDLTQDVAPIFLLSNRATYAVIMIIGSIHKYLVAKGILSISSTGKERRDVMRPYMKALAAGLNNLPEEESVSLRNIQGSGAEKKWLMAYENIVNKFDSEYEPDGLQEWRETQDQSLQKAGKEIKDDIFKQLRRLLFERLEMVYKHRWLSGQILILKNEVENRIIKGNGDSPDFDLSDYDWRDYLELSEYKDVISKNFSYTEFEEVFAINTGGAFKTKTDKLAWLSLLNESKNKKSALKKSDINRLELINRHLQQFIAE